MNQCSRSLWNPPIDPKRQALRECLFVRFLDDVQVFTPKERLHRADRRIYRLLEKRGFIADCATLFSITITKEGREWADINRPYAQAVWGESRDDAWSGNSGGSWDSEKIELLIKTYCQMQQQLLENMNHTFYPETAPSERLDKLCAPVGYYDPAKVEVFVQGMKMTGFTDHDVEINVIV